MATLFGSDSGFFCISENYLGTREPRHFPATVSLTWNPPIHPPRHLSVIGSVTFMQGTRQEHERGHGAVPERTRLGL